MLSEVKEQYGHQPITEGKTIWPDFGSIQFPSPPLPFTRLGVEVLERLCGYIYKATLNVNDRLAGNITQSLELVDEEGWFFKTILSPVCVHYLEDCPLVQSSRPPSQVPKGIRLESLWVNFSKQHEFNPPHNHSGVISFVIWMNIPTRSSDQHNNPISKNSDYPAASDFQFLYSNILGNISTYSIPMDPELNGTLILFPATLSHTVFPFYNCQEDRVSISGNINYV